MTSGGSMPMRSSSVGITSIACTYWCACVTVGADAVRPVHDQRIRDTTFVRVALEPLERRVPRPRPTPRVVVVRQRTAEIVDAAQVLLEALGHEVEEVLLVERALRAAFGRRAVVAHHEHDRVVELTELGDEVEQSGDLRVGVREEAGVHLHHARGRVAARRPSASPRPAPRTAAPRARVSGGSRPDSSCRANTASRQRSHPASNCPR